MNKSKATIVVDNREQLRVAAASARISTQPGTAMALFESSRGDERDLKLIGKVMSSGHKSVIEHQTFAVAFNDVSVLAEQFIIECRLASFTVKSRRYVDFGSAGWVCPTGMDDRQKKCFVDAMEDRFEDYRKLLALGVPREDARFVLPYALRSNFYMTANARELIAVIGAMLHGRGRGYPEIEALGEQLKEQFEERYPGIIDRECEHFPPCAAPGKWDRTILRPAEARGEAVLLSMPADAAGLLERTLAFSGRFPIEEGRYSHPANI